MIAKYLLRVTTSYIGKEDKKSVVQKVVWVLQAIHSFSPGVGFVVHKHNGASRTRIRIGPKKPSSNPGLYRLWSQIGGPNSDH